MKSKKTTLWPMMIGGGIGVPLVVLAVCGAMGVFETKPLDLPKNIVKEQEIPLEEFETVKARFANQDKGQIYACLFDYSTSYTGRPKQMKETALAQCQRDLDNILSSQKSLLGGTTVFLASLGRTSFGPEAFQQRIQVNYPFMPAPPEIWYDRDLGKRTDDDLRELRQWRTAWRSWRLEAEALEKTRRDELQNAFQLLAKRASEPATNIVSVVELILRSTSSDWSGRLEMMMFSDMEEDIDGRGKQHRRSELARWCAENNLKFPPNTQIKLYVSTMGGTLTPLEKRWTPFFAGCGVSPASLRFISLSRQEDALHTVAK